MVFLRQSLHFFGGPGRRKKNSLESGRRVRSAAFQTAPHYWQCYHRFNFKNTCNTGNIYVRSKFLRAKKIKRPEHLKKRRRTCCRESTRCLLRCCFCEGSLVWPTVNAECSHWRSLALEMFPMFKDDGFFFLFFLKVSEGWICLFYQRPSNRIKSETVDPEAIRSVGNITSNIMWNVTFLHPNIILAISDLQNHITSQYHCIYYHFFYMFYFVSKMYVSKCSIWWQQLELFHFLSLQLGLSRCIHYNHDIKKGNIHIVLMIHIT